MEGAKKSATKLTSVFINVLFVGFGLACMAVGAWGLLYREEVKVLTLIDSATNDLGLFQNAAILLITSGVGLFALGILGCCATYQEQKCLRVIYLGLVTLCCFVSISSCVVAFKYRDQVEENLLSYLHNRLKSEYEGYSTSTMDFSQAFDYAQVEFQCCGIENYTDFAVNARKWTVRTSAVVPPTCCILNNKDDFLKDQFISLVDTNCVQNPNVTNSYINQPCRDPLKHWMEKVVVVIGGIAIATIVVQVMGILFMVILMQQRDKASNYLYRDTLSHSSR